MIAEIFSIGNEITNGDIVNTNAGYIAFRLKQIGIDIIAHRSVRDNKAEILRAFNDAFIYADVIITTGGLGPTVDDITKECAAEYFNMTPVVHEESLAKMRNFFKSLCREMPENNIKQAMFPADAHILVNERGTAPGAVFSRENKKIAMLPGPPAEMTFMFDNYLYPYFKNMSGSVFKSRTIKFAGLGESMMDDILKDILNENGNPKAAPYAKNNYCQVTLTANAETEKQADVKIAAVESEINSRLGKYIFGYDDEEIEDTAAKRLIAEKLSLVTAESCTGGLIAGRMLNFSGSSGFFNEGYVTYSNESKMSLLGVKKETLEKFGAVSEETVSEMLDGALLKSGSDIAVAVSGIAGPSGGTQEKPVGLVLIGLKHGEYKEIKRLNLSGNRNRIRERTVFLVIDMLRIYLNTL
ncbi:MAG: competence/damage-inducible protein A [Spirochaetes bacterium]|nr:competence/damage-inducible protein A [Spirochaetota bacterium]